MGRPKKTACSLSSANTSEIKRFSPHSLAISQSISPPLVPRKGENDAPHGAYAEMRKTCKDYFPSSDVLSIIVSDFFPLWPLAHAVWFIAPNEMRGKYFVVFNLHLGPRFPRDIRCRRTTNAMMHLLVQFLRSIFAGGSRARREKKRVHRKLFYRHPYAPDTFYSVALEPSSRQGGKLRDCKSSLKKKNSLNWQRDSFGSHV